MNLAELFASEELRQREFPVAREKVFLAHAGVCPLPRRVAEAVARCAAEGSTDDQEKFLARLLLDTRELAAQMIGAHADEIAFVGPTSLALSYVAAGLEFRGGDNVLIYFDDYPSNVYPWMALADRGVEVRFINVRELGRLRPADVLGQVDERTRLVALASCHFLAGWRIDVDAIGEGLHRRGILFCLDAIQTLGAFPTQVKHVDFLAADAHKWLLGPCAAGILYVRKALQAKLRPPIYGWHNVRCPDFVAQEEIVFKSDAKRYEAGSHNILGIVGLKAALELLMEVGVDEIGRELLRKRAMLVPALQSKGYTVLQANAPVTNASGIVTFFKSAADMPVLQQKFAAQNIVVSLRADRSGQQHLRLSPHFYNTDAELERVLSML